MRINNEISAEIEKPVRSKNALAVLLPGYLDSKNYDHLKILSESLNELGFMTIRFDPSGTWDSAGDLALYNMSSYLADISEVMKWAKKTNGREFESIILVGHSMGGEAAIIYGATHPEISAIIGIMPPSERLSKSFISRMSKWRDAGSKRSKRDVPGRENSFEYFDVPYSFILDRTKYNIESLIKDYNKPILLIAGELDDVVLSASVEKIYDLANEPKKFVIMRGIGHDYRHNISEIEKVNGEIVKFLSWTQIVKDMLK